MTSVEQLVGLILNKWNYEQRRTGSSTRLHISSIFSHTSYAISSAVLFGDKTATIRWRQWNVLLRLLEINETTSKAVQGVGVYLCIHKIYLVTHLKSSHQMFCLLTKLQQLVEVIGTITPAMTSLSLYNLSLTRTSLWKRYLKARYFISFSQRICWET